MYCVYDTNIMRCVNMYNITLSIDGRGSICIDIHLYAQSDRYNWHFGPCHSSYEYSGGRTYTEKCCAPNGDHIFSCKDTKGSGWDNSVVTIGNHQFCDDIVRYNQLSTINISGGIVPTFAYAHKELNYHAES